MILAFKIGFLEINWKDIIDILLVTFLLVRIYKLMRGSVAIKVFMGFLVFYLVYLVVDALEMELVSTILGQFMGVGVLAAIILFQQEIRKFLLLVGRGNLFENQKIITRMKFWNSTNGASTRMNINPIIEACKEMSKEKTGALIVISANSPLRFYADTGDEMDAMLSKRLLISIFNKYSPLHDGAVIINKDRIVAARCILPVTERSDIPAKYGLRHRAALGMSENTETLIITVSEETGQISCMKSGTVTSNISTTELRKQINSYLNQTKKTTQTEETESAKVA